MKSKFSPLYDEKYGMLLCPNCRSPLLTKETRSGRFKCVVCDRYVGKLSEGVMIKMLDNFPKELLREWMMEMR